MSLEASNSLYVTGPTRICGNIKVSGSKNAALPVIAATILAESGTCTLDNVPRLSDIQSIIELIGMLNTEIRYNDSDELRLCHSTTQSLALLDSCCRKTRASILFLGPLLARFGYASILHPGGCQIGSRPIDQHISGLKALGAEITVQDDQIIAHAPSGLHGATIVMNNPPSVTGTENILMAATLAKGRTVLKNPALEPEIEDLVAFLNKMGARISRDNERSYLIDGVKALAGTAHTIMGDRLEAGTFLIAAAATQGSIQVHGVNPNHLSIVLDKLKQTGCNIKTSNDTITLKAPKTLKATSISTAPYPGFPTDLQPQWLSLMCLAQGEAVVEEKLFENRFKHVASLKKLGAKMQDLSAHSVTVEGTLALASATLQASDIRAGASLIIAALQATGRSQIQMAHYIDRGYEDISEKLQKLGVQVERTA